MMQHSRHAASHLAEVGAREGTRLTAPARAFYAAVARGVLGGLLPAEPLAQAASLEGHLQRLEQAIAGMPPSVQQEIDDRPSPACRLRCSRRSTS